MGVAAPAIGLGMTAAQGINSGIKGKNAANAAEQTQQRQMGLGEQLLGTGQQMLGTIRDANQGFTNQRLGSEVLGMARQAGGNLSDIANQASGQLGALAGQIPGGQITGPNAQNFDFYQAQGVNPDQLSATIQEAQAFGDRARAGALDQAGQAFTAGQGALNQALASRGISANSGVAGGALSNLAAQGAQAQAGLSRDLANQAGQQALQAGQFDVQNRLAGQQMLGNLNLGQQQLLGNYNLGLNQLGQQAQQSTFQNQLAGTQLGADLLGRQAQFGMQGAMAPYELLNAQYQQNYLAPQLQTLGMMNPGAFIQGGLGAIQDVGRTQTAGAQQAGAGKGSAKGALPGILETFSVPSGPTPTGGGRGGTVGTQGGGGNVVYPS